MLFSGTRKLERNESPLRAPVPISLLDDASHRRGRADLCARRRLKEESVSTKLFLWIGEPRKSAPLKSYGCLHGAVARPTLSSSGYDPASIWNPQLNAFA